MSYYWVIEEALQSLMHSKIQDEENWRMARSYRRNLFHLISDRKYYYGSGGGGGRRVGAANDVSNGIKNFLGLLTQHKRTIGACVSFTKDYLRESGIAFIKDKEGNLRLEYEIATKERPYELQWNHNLKEGETVIAIFHVHYERDGCNGVDAFSVFDEATGGGDLMSAISLYDQSKGKGFILSMISTESNLLYILEVATVEQRNAIHDGIFRSFDLRPWDISITTWNGNKIANETNEKLRTGIYGNFYMKPYILDPNIKKANKFIIY